MEMERAVLGDPVRGCAATCMRHGCDWLDICLFMRQQPPHVLSIAAADEHIIRLLQRSGLGCRGSSREGGAGGRDCPLPSSREEVALRSHKV